MTYTEAVAFAINRRFVLGTGANNDDLASAGVVVHQTDAMDGGDGGVPWMTNDAYPDRFAASLVNAKAPYMYSTSAVGIVISPAHLSMEDLWCIYPRDGNTMGQGNHGCGQGAYTTFRKCLRHSNAVRLAATACGESQTRLIATTACITRAGPQG